MELWDYRILTPVALKCKVRRNKILKYDEMIDVQYANDHPECLAEMKKNPKMKYLGKGYVYSVGGVVSSGKFEGYFFEYLV